MSNEKLVAEYARTRSPATLDKIVRGNQRLLHHILKRFAYADEPYEDLLQVANLGLIKAAQRFDPERGVSFATYATALVDGEIRHHLRDSLLMRQPRWVKKVYGRITEATAELTRESGRPPTLSELAQALNIKQEGILEVLGIYSRIELHSANEPFGDDDLHASADRTVLRSLRQASFSLPIEDRIALYDALDALSAYQRRIIYLLFFREFTQHEVAVALGLTQKRVSRESIKALARLKQVMTRKVI